VAGQAKRAAPVLFEFNSAVAAALCAVPVSAVCAKAYGVSAEVVSSSGNRVRLFCMGSLILAVGYIAYSGSNIDAKARERNGGALTEQIGFVDWCYPQSFCTAGIS
jgi:hypothetical protein